MNRITVIMGSITILAIVALVAIFATSVKTAAVYKIDKRPDGSRIEWVDFDADKEWDRKAIFSAKGALVELSSEPDGVGFRTREFYKNNKLIRRDHSFLEWVTVMRFDDPKWREVHEHFYEGKLHHTIYYGKSADDFIRVDAKDGNSKGNMK